MQNPNVVNMPSRTVAPLKNVSLAYTAMQRAIERPHHLPGMVAFYGPSGWGKTIAASYVANKTRAYYVECKSTWTKKALLLSILHAQGVQPAHTIYEMVDQVASQLVSSGKPLIIDEMDHIVDKKAVELVRDIYEASNAPILMGGEEHFPHKLQRWERFHNRVLMWQQAQPADIDDVAHLANLYVPKTRIHEDLLAEILRRSRQSVRRVVVNLENVRVAAEKEGWDQVSLAQYGNRELYTGEAPVRRVIV